MELIIRVADQGGRPPEYHRVDGERITLGRALDNDLIMHDPAVSPHHAVIETDGMGQLVLRDMNSLNGVFVEPHERVNGMVTVYSGQELLMGKTRVSIYTPQHPVPDAIPIEKTSGILALLDNPLVLPLALLMVVLIHALEQWLNMFGEFKWQGIINIQLAVLGTTVLIALFWSVVGRVFRHESNFRKQITLLLVFMVVQVLVSKFFEVLLFNTLDYGFSLVVMLSLEFVLMAWLLTLNLSLATNQTAGQRRRTAVVISAVLISLSLYTEMGFDDGFSDRPDYIKLLAPPALQLAGTVSEEEYLTGAAEVFARLEEETE